MNKKTLKVDVKNYQTYANSYPYIVAKVVNGEAWFYGAYESEERCREVVNELGGGIIIINEW